MADKLTIELAKAFLQWTGNAYPALAAAVAEAEAPAAPAEEPVAPHPSNE